MDARGIRRSRTQEDEESYFVSMADMMVGLLFIFLILLLYFALQFRQTTATLTGAGETRRQILMTLKERLEPRLRPYHLIVHVDPETGVLSLRGGVLFGTAEFRLSEQGRQAIAIVADELAAVLPCYTDVEPGGPRCEGRAPAAHKIDAIFIEGHTDRVPLSRAGPLSDNLDLSALRATNTFRHLLDSRRELNQLVNASGPRPTPVFGVSGYGERRPSPDALGDDEVANSRNRRIDLRFLMITPPSETINEISNAVVAR